MAEEQYATGQRVSVIRTDATERQQRQLELFLFSHDHFCHLIDRPIGVIGLLFPASTSTHRSSLPPFSMRFHVLGLGPIGSILAHSLRRHLPHNPPIVLIRRHDSPHNRATSITVESNGRVTTARDFASELFDAPMQPSSNAPPPQSHLTSGRIDVPETTAIQSLFVAAKAQNTLPAIQQLAPRLTPASTIVLLQNGMGMYEELAQHVFPNPSLRPHIILASNTHGAYALPNGHIVHTGLGSIEFGIVPGYACHNFEASYSSSPDRQLSINDITMPGSPEFERYQYLRTTVAALLLLQDLNVSWKPISHLQLAMRRKLVVNAVINPLTALMRCRNGDLFNAPGAADLSAKVCQEAADVFAAHMQAGSSEFSDAAANYTRLPSLLQPRSLEEEVRRIAKLTANNKSSMLCDIERHRETEIDYINGYLVRLGRAHHVPTPTTETLYHLIKMRSALPLDQMFV